MDVDDDASDDAVLGPPQLAAVATDASPPAGPPPPPSPAPLSAPAMDPTILGALRQPFSMASGVSKLLKPLCRTASDPAGVRTMLQPGAVLAPDARSSEHAALHEKAIKTLIKSRFCDPRRWTAADAQKIAECLARRLKVQYQLGADGQAAALL